MGWQGLLHVLNRGKRVWVLGNECLPGARTANVPFWICVFSNSSRAVPSCEEGVAVCVALLPAVRWWCGFQRTKTVGL